MTTIRREFRVFAGAVGFLTRLPVPFAVSDDEFASTPRYFPLVGVLVGAIGATVWWLSSLILPGPVAVVLSMIATIVSTGAFHEDGFADVCDGFGGGYDRERVLAIMKDSRVGAFGAIGVVLMLGLKAATLMYVPADRMAATLLAGHALSRWAALTVMATQTYVRAGTDGKAKPVAAPLGRGPLLVGTILGLVPMVGLPLRLCWTVVGVLLVRWWLGRWFLRRIGGYTGDCLGATQQVCEAVFYLFVVALTWR